MCGIIGYVGKQDCVYNLIEGIQRLEYRGYDSVGIGLLTPELKVFKKIGSAKNLLPDVQSKATIGIAHTRWATHGEVNLVNCHPHVSRNKKIAIVHNGIVENYNEVKQFLLSHGYTFETDTDTEIIANLVEFYYNKNLSKAVWFSVNHLKGSNTFVAIAEQEKELVGVRIGDVTCSPLYVGLASDGFYFASDTIAFEKWCKTYITVNNKEIVSLNEKEYKFTSTLYNLYLPTEHPIEQLAVSVSADINGYSKYMQKEIFEQPFTIKQTIDNFKQPSITQNYTNFIIVGCGSAYYAGLAIKNELEKYNVNVSVQYSHEFRYCKKNIPLNTCVIAISQSGETSDTLHAAMVAKQKNLKVVSIVNVKNSSIAKESDEVIYLNCGSEVGVAATKSFTSQLYVGYQLLSARKQLNDLPNAINNVLDIFPKVSSIANKYKDYNSILILAKQNLYPIALEGALKIKEVSYIHAEALPMSELKHGSIALISKQIPSIFLIQSGEMLPKIITSMREVKSRGGLVIAISPSNIELDQSLYDDIIQVDVEDSLLEFAYTVVLQLMAYYLGAVKGYDVDKPRNLAKSVTVD